MSGAGRGEAGHHNLGRQVDVEVTGISSGGDIPRRVGLRDPSRRMSECL